jgi:hypothetical protein
MDPQTIPLALPLEVVYWASSLSDDTTQKVKFCDVHPESPWIVSAEKNTIYVWDFLRLVCFVFVSLAVHHLSSSSRRDCLVEKTIAEILESMERSKRHSSPLLPLSNSFVANRTFSSHSVHGSFLQRIKSGNEPLEQLPAAHLRAVGEIKRVVFVDRLAMQWTCGGITIPPTSDSFHSSNRLMILCDGALLFYDFVSGVTHAITPADLGRVNICSAEFIYTDLCAIGGADGSIRFLTPSLSRNLTRPGSGIACIGNLSRPSPPQDALRSRLSAISCLAGPLVLSTVLISLVVWVPLRREEQQTLVFAKEESAS